MEVHGHGGDVRHDGHGPIQEEHPSGDVRALLAEEFARVGDERTGRRAADRQLTQCAHHEECEDAADDVRERESGAALRKAPARAEEQAGADGTADGDHLDVPWFQFLCIAGVAFVTHGATLRRCRVPPRRPRGICGGLRGVMRA